MVFIYILNNCFTYYYCILDIPWYSWNNLLLKLALNTNQSMYTWLYRLNVDCIKKCLLFFTGSSNLHDFYLRHFDDDSSSDDSSDISVDHVSLNEKSLSAQSSRAQLSTLDEVRFCLFWEHFAKIPFTSDSRPFLDPLVFLLPKIFKIILFFQLFYFVCTRWRLFQKYVVCTK